MALVHTYKIKSYVNASHAMRWADGEGKQHTHTWEIICEIKSKNDEMIVFRDIEQAISDVLDSFSGKFLNKLPYFKEINPTVENVTVWLFDLITPEMERLSARLIRIEVGESPTRSYCITVED
ncbi:6-carboxytetrahydropterin synthase [Loigolactobacillus coryniformis]|uniref:6-carboxytetrahydropterin synthase n=1 Tax=Loigolactobacillus coryniformis TaxID=1610 RepID=UPI002341D850|nr:6-carboxytetrahydropterin synthase [Loigolactobacillus coryniformis]MDC4187103.1 6-carboxytetrahydropterin synthase [Loigolactobacillus coryniformis]